MQTFTTYDTVSMTHCDVICDARGLDLMHQVHDNVLKQALTCLSTECKDHHTLASPIWYNVNWHLVWLSEHLTKVRHKTRHKLPLKWGFTITSGGLPIFSVANQSGNERWYVLHWYVLHRVEETYQSATSIWIYWRVIIGVVELQSKEKMACTTKCWAKGLQ